MHKTASSSHRITDRHCNSQHVWLLTAAWHKPQLSLAVTFPNYIQYYQLQLPSTIRTEQKHIKHYWHWRLQSSACDAVSFSEWSPTFRSIMLLSPSGVKIFQEVQAFFIDCLNHEDEPKTTPCSTIRRHTPEGLNPQQHPCENFMLPTTDIFISNFTLSYTLQYYICVGH
jgi:hypothetical protein